MEWEAHREEQIKKKKKKVKRKPVCDSFTDWLWANSHWPCF